MSEKAKRNFPIIIVLLLFAFVMIKNAWICDDAMITFRTVMNLLHGYGAVFNVGERVQAYTHPLWFVLIVLGTFVFGNIYIFTFVFSVLIALSVLFILFKTTNQEKPWFWVWMIPLLLSKAFVEYSTSGLENSLSHLMLVSGFALGFYFLKTSLEKYAITSLLILVSVYLSRPDLILIVLPFCILILWKLSPSMRIQYAILSLIPAAIWTIFSVIYYGFPFPNTAYAKLNIAIPRYELVYQGAVYLWDSACRDPITLFTVIFSLSTSAFSKRKEIKALALGIGLYLLYILWIGGDFMSGRFLTASLVCAVMILNQTTFPIHKRKWIAAGIFFIGLFSFHSTFLSPRIYPPIRALPENGVMDEKTFWYGESGFFSPTSKSFAEPQWKAGEKSMRRTCGTLGRYGMESGPSTYFVDICGLSDPLLARIPPFHQKYHWRPGHFYRRIPTNYEYVIETGDETGFTDLPTQIFWKNLRVLTHEPLFSIRRFKTIWTVNMGLVPRPDFNMYLYENIPSQILPISVFANRKIPQNLQDMGLYPFVYSIELVLDAPTSIRSVDLSLFGEFDCALQYREEGKDVTFLNLQLNPNMVNRFRLRLPNPTPKVSRIKITGIPRPDNPLSNPSLGHLYINTL